MKKIVGNKKIIDKLNAQIKNGQFSHAHLFVGPKSVGKFTFALNMAKEMLCSKGSSCENCTDCNLFESGNHPDLLVFSGEESIKIEDSRSIKGFCTLKPLRAKGKIIILKGIERLTNEAGNSLLKIIEEPEGFCTFIFTATNEKSILKTIVSRCQISIFNTVSEKELLDSVKEENLSFEEKLSLVRISAGKPGLLKHFLAKKDELNDYLDEIQDLISKGSYGKRFELAEKLSKEKELNEIINRITLFFRDILLLKNGISDKIVYHNRKEDILEKTTILENKNINSILKLLKNIQEGLGHGLNTRLSLENLFLLMEQK